MVQLHARVLFAQVHLGQLPHWADGEGQGRGGQGEEAERVLRGGGEEEEKRERERETYCTRVPILRVFVL